MSFAAVLERLDTIENPYPGLRSFEAGDAHLFFGRDRHIAELTNRLERNRFVAVVGVSGSGKSSLVRAGLIPALERGHLADSSARWRMVVTRPAGAPFTNLTEQLEKAGFNTLPLRHSSYGLIHVAQQLASDESLLVVVDQFEEIFRYKDQEPVSDDARRRRDQAVAEAYEFVQLLLAASRYQPPVYIVITMRSDYLGDCAEFRDLPEILNECQYLIPRLMREERKQAIECPLGNVEISPVLVQRMLNDAGDEPDQLPILQHALMRTWDHWRKADPSRTRKIELQDYEAIGGFDNVLDQHADELLKEVPRDIAAIIFKRLTARDRTDRERREPAKLSELSDLCDAKTQEEQSAVTGLINRFRRREATFLLPGDGDLKPETYIDIAHESLIRQWKTLRDQWLPDETQSAKTFLDLVKRSGNWKSRGGALLNGLDLGDAVEWENQRNRTSAWASHYANENAITTVLEFIKASQTEERKRATRAKRNFWFAVAMSVVFAILASVAVYEWRQVQRGQSTAVQQARLAEETKFKNLQKDREFADAQKRIIEQADEARRDAANAEEARNKTSVQLLASKAALKGTEGNSALPLSMLLAAESMRRDPLIDNQATLSKGLPVLPKALKELPNSSRIEKAKFSRDGLLVTSEPSVVRVWDPISQTKLREFPITGNADALAVSGDGELVAIAYQEKNLGIICVYNMHTGELDGRRTTAPGVRYVYIGQNGNLVVQVGFGRMFYHWKSWSDEDGSIPEGPLSEAGLGGVQNFAFNSELSLVAQVQPEPDRSNTRITIYDLQTGKQVTSWTSPGHVVDIVSDPSDKNRFASFDDDGNIKIWSVDNRQPVLSLHAGSISWERSQMGGVQFSADGYFLAAINYAAANRSVTVRVWDARDGTEVTSLSITRRVPHNLATNTSNIYINTGRPPRGNSQGGGISVALGANRIIALTQEGPPQWWQIPEVPLPELIIAADISTDGVFAALGAPRRATETAVPTIPSLLLWNVGESQAEPQPDSYPIKQVLAMSADLHLAAGSCEGGSLCVVRFDNGKAGALIRRSKNPVKSGRGLTFSRDGRFLAGNVPVPRDDGRIQGAIVWDINTQDAEPEIIMDGSAPLNATVLGFSPESDRCILVKTPTQDGKPGEKPGEVKLWDLNKRSFSLVVPKPFEQPPLSIAFSADGHWLATSERVPSPSADVTEQNYRVSIWRWPDGNKPDGRFDADTRVDKMSFSLDHRFLITAGTEAFIRVWEKNTGKERGRVGLLRPSVPLAMRFIAGDRRILAFDQYSVTNSFWKAQDVRREVCERIGRSLSPEEWKKYLPHDEKYVLTCQEYLGSH